MKKTKDFWVILYFCDEKYYIALDDDEKVIGFNSEREGLWHFEGAYRECHKASFERSMSACIYMIEWQPKIVKCAGVEGLRKTLLPNVPDKDLELFNLSSVSGFARGILGDPKKCATAWKKGATPKLTQTRGK